MASVVAEKLYPPTIPSSIPAFYVENGTAKIAVPFSMNRAVDADSVAGFRIKIKTVQSNTLVKVLDISTDASAKSAINSRIAYFDWVAEIDNERTPEFNRIKMGQFLKVQMAYLGKNRQPGYFSTVAITKYTSKPLVSIANADVKDDPNAVPVFRQSYTGVYKTGEDTTERPYSYCFYLFNATKGLEETSGWKLHNTSVNRVAAESIALDQSIDTYTFTAPMQDDKLYYIQYGVRTINNLEVYSPLYPVFQALTDETQLQATLVAENNFDNAYVKLSLNLNEGITTNTPWPIGGNNAYLSIQIERASKNTNYQDWCILKKIAFLNYAEVAQWSFKDFTVEQGKYYLYRFRQYSENGISSKGSAIAEPILADFEDMFLWDGQKQLKIRFNPKVTSFKSTLMEQKVETIGSQYPFIFKNGIVNYKEFPIAGMLSYTVDNDELFVDYEKDLDIKQVVEFQREGTPATFSGYDEKYVEIPYEVVYDYYYNICQEDSAKFNSNNAKKFYYNVGVIGGEPDYRRYTLGNVARPSSMTTYYELVRIPLYSKEIKVSDKPVASSFNGANIAAERTFKLKALEWLNDGNVKMFKSPTEGNYLVRLMNVSLTPEDRLGRMLHTLQATAYEMETLTYSNLIDLDFVSVDDYEVSQIITMSEPIAISGIIDRVEDNSSFQRTSIQLNQYLITNSLEISPAGGAHFFVRIGEDIPENKVFIGTDFTLAAENVSLPNVWFNPADNTELIQTMSQNGGQPTKANCLTLIGNSTISYGYYATSTAVGSFYGIESITVKNKVETWAGPRKGNSRISFGAVSVTNQGLNIEPVIMKIWALEFTKKVCKTKLIHKNNKYYLYDNQSVQVTVFDTNQLYQVIESPYNANTSNVKIYYSTDGESLTAGTNNDHVGFYQSTEDADFYDNNVDQKVTLTYYRDLTAAEQAAKEAALAAIDEAIQAINSNTGLTSEQKAQLIIQKNMEANTILNEYGPYSVTFDIPPVINLYEHMNYNQIEFGWGVTLKIAYQERSVKYH